MDTPGSLEDFEVRFVIPGTGFSGLSRERSSFASENILFQTSKLIDHNLLLRLEFEHIKCQTSVNGVNEIWGSLKIVWSNVTWEVFGRTKGPPRQFSNCSE